MAGTTSEPEPFSIDRRQDGDRLILAPHGELDLATVPELEAAALPAIRSGEEVVIDLRGLSFMDSSGVRALIAGHTAAQASGGALTVVRAPRGSAVDRVVEVSGIDSGLTMVEEL